MLSSLRLAFVMMVVCALAGCKVAVYSRASEASANEVLSALLEAGIDADKIAVDEKSFDIEVAQGDLTRALALMRGVGLPREGNENLGQLFKKEGLVSTPAEERVRYIYGVSQELEKTLSRIDGVVAARVHIVIPANDPLSDTKRFSSASVFVKYRAPVDPNSMGPVIRTLVLRAIEGLDNDRVSVAFVAAEPTAASSMRFVHWLGMKVSSESLLWLNLFLVAMLVAPSGAAYWYVRHRLSRRAKAANAKSATVKGHG
jgi:type III secretion protein J